MGRFRVRVLGLQQAAQRQLIVFFLILLAVRLGTEFAAARKFFEQGKLLPAVETAHASFIGQNGRILKGRKRFTYVKVLMRTESIVLWGYP